MATDYPKTFKNKDGVTRTANSPREEAEYKFSGYREVDTDPRETFSYDEHEDAS